MIWVCLSKWRITQFVEVLIVKMMINHGTWMDLVVPNLQRARPKGQGTAGVQCQTWQEHGQLEGIAKHNGHAWRVAE
jgi:hypothetical protein